MNKKQVDITMTKSRWEELMRDDSLSLTDQEIKEGWHFCFEFDGLLVGPGMEEYDYCTCSFKQQ